jgi:plasmid stabilization system protein ParE
MAEEFTIEIEPEALDDIQKAIDYYNSQKTGLGKRFYKKIERSFEFLKKHAFSFAVRYDDIRCMPLKKFPYLIHYRIKEKPQKIISIKAVFSTHRDPEDWKNRL